MAQDVLDLFQRLTSDRFIIGPFGFALADSRRIFPVEHAGMIAKNVANAGIVKLRGSGPDYIVVDIDRLRHGPADISDDTIDPHAGALPPGGVHAEGRLDLEEGQP